MRSPNSNKRKCALKSVPDDGAKKRKRACIQGIENLDEAHLYKPCFSTQCTGIQPVCFLAAAPRCAGNCNTARWAHVSLGEHFCNCCFEYYYRNRHANERGYRVFDEWRHQWLARLTGEPSVKDFAVNEILPYWAQCIKCSKWRQLPRKASLAENLASTKEGQEALSVLHVTPKLLENFTCSLLVKKESRWIKSLSELESQDWEKACCDIAEDERVALAHDARFLSSAQYTCLLQGGPSAPLLRPYHTNEVGLAPCAARDYPLEEDEDSEEGEEGEDAKERCCKLDLSWDEDAGPGELLNDVIHRRGPEEPRHRRFAAGGRRLHPCVQPFYLPGDQQRALGLLPNSVQVDELHEFPTFERHKSLYLGIRNTLIALWSQQPTRFVTVQRLGAHILVRGLLRVAAVAALPALVAYFTCRGVVNCGLPDNGRLPAQPLLSAEFRRDSVLVVGAGTAGLAAARQLRNFGCCVRLLEAADRIGGRILDEVVPADVLSGIQGVSLPLGAGLVQGSVNNPLCLLALQTGTALRRVSENAVLLRTDQKHCTPIAPAVVRHADLHFASALDAISSCPRSAEDRAASLVKSARDDVTLESVLRAKLARVPTRQDDKELGLQEAVFQFYMANLEYSTGGSLAAQSANHWDLHESFAQFRGAMVQVDGGIGALLLRLADGLDVLLNERVTTVDIRHDASDGTKVVLTTASGASYSADRVLITVPPCAVREIQWKPPLAPIKKKAVERFNAGAVETVTLVFNKRWWDAQLQEAFRTQCASDESIVGAPTWLGRVPGPDGELLCHLIRDLDPIDRRLPILQAVYSGASAESLIHMENDQVLKQTLSALSSIFPLGDGDSSTVWPPPPVWFRVSRWRQGFSTVKPSGAVEEVGDAASNPRDCLADDIEGRVFFAGEATNTHFPQTVAGAYLSGLREAGRIAEFSAFSCT